MLTFLKSFPTAAATECGKRLIIYTMQFIDFDVEYDLQVNNSLIFFQNVRVRFYVRRHSLVTHNTDFLQYRITFVR